MTGAKESKEENRQPPKTKTSQRFISMGLVYTVRGKAPFAQMYGTIQMKARMYKQNFEYGGEQEIPGFTARYVCRNVGNMYIQYGSRGPRQYGNSL